MTVNDKWYVHPMIKHGKWINKRLTKDSIKDIKDGTYGELIGYHDVCSICGFDLDKYWSGYKPPYCPNCGAKMDKDRYSQGL